MAEKTIAQKIEEDARAGIERVKVDGTDVTAMSIEDRITADQYRKEETAVGKNHLGFTFRTFVPGGTG